MIWKDLSEDDLDALERLEGSPKEQFDAFKNAMKLPQLAASVDTDMIYKDVLMDLLYLSYRYGSDQTWTPAQTSAYVSLMKECVLRSFFEVDECGPLVLEESYRAFAKMVRALAVPFDGPDSTAVFSLLQVVEIIDQASTSFFKHYQSYAKTFAKPCLTSTRPIKFKMAIPRRETPVPSLEHASNQEIEVYAPQQNDLVTEVSS